MVGCVVLLEVLHAVPASGGPIQPDARAPRLRRILRAFAPEAELGIYPKMLSGSEVRG
jgi:hypothetical protein